MRKPIAWLLPLAILATGAVGFAASTTSKPKTTPLASEEKAWTVAVKRLRAANAAPQLSLYGRVESPGVARLTAAIDGDVVAVHVLEGELVAAERELVTLDARETQLVVRQRRADVTEIKALIENELQRHTHDGLALAREKRLVELAERAVARATNLARKNAGSQSTLDSAHQAQEREAMAVERRTLAIKEHRGRLGQLQARLARAEALRDRAELDLTRTHIRAPFPARVTAVKTAHGNRVRVGEELVTLFDVGRVELRAQIPSRHLSLVKTALAERTESRGLTALAKVDGTVVKMRLDRLGGEVGKDSGGVYALFAIVAGGANLQLGRTLSIRLDLPEIHDVFALPPEAVYGSRTAYRIADGRMRSVAVRRRGSMVDTQGRAHILVSAPSLGDTEDFVVTQLPNAADGLKVRVSDPAPQLSAN